MLYVNQEINFEYVQEKLLHCVKLQFLKLELYCGFSSKWIWEKGYLTYIMCLNIFFFGLDTKYKIWSYILCNRLSFNFVRHREVFFYIFLENMLLAVLVAIC